MQRPSQNPSNWVGNFPKFFQQTTLMTWVENIHIHMCCWGISQPDRHLTGCPVDSYFQNTLLEKAQYHKQILWGNIKSDRLHVLSDDRCTQFWVKSLILQNWRFVKSSRFISGLSIIHFPKQLLVIAPFPDKRGTTSISPYSLSPKHKLKCISFLCKFTDKTASHLRKCVLPNWEVPQ